MDVAFLGGVGRKRGRARVHVRGGAFSMGCTCVWRVTVVDP